MKCFWCDGERPAEELYRCFHCKTLVCEGCGPRHFGEDGGHKQLALEAGFWKRRALQQSTQCGCPACRDGTVHASDCAVHNEPAYPNGPCNCGATQPPSQEPSK